MTIGKAFPSEYKVQLNTKIAYIHSLFSDFTTPELEIFPSPPSHFRMRAEFKIWHEDNKCFYAMYKQGEYKKPYKIDAFTIGSDTICTLMPPLLSKLNNSELLKRKLFQVEFLTTTTGDAVITLIYHKPLEDDWRNEALILGNDLNVKIIGRSRKQKIILDNDYVIEEFNLNNGQFKYQQVETGFTQPNGFVCQDMLNWACSASECLTDDLLELYCGNGNFTLPLSKSFSKVLATEVSKTSVNSAFFNIENNQCNNIAIARLSSEEFTQAINKEREFNRLKDINLDDYNFSTVFVDPPRAGLDDDTTEMVGRFDNILYISCNPETLKANLNALNTTHKITKFALFDQFPYTNHCECGVLLTKR